METIDWFTETKIKLFANDNLRFSPPGTPLGTPDADGKLILAGIPMVDVVSGMDQITKPRVFFIALPVKMKRVTASWTRAIALEEIDS